MPQDDSAETHAITPYPSEFSGSGGEFFRVWIVNVLLTIVTLGFYTPFARRRTVQYFYGHTLIAGSPLEFTAQQRKMVIGFVILVILYGTMRVAADTGQDAVVALFVLAGAGLAPYFWASAMRFRLNATRWRGVRLQFTATWAEVYRASWPVFALAGIWIAVNLLTGVIIPDLPEDAPKRAADFPLAPVLAIVGVAAIASFLCFVRLEFNYKSLAVARARIGGQPGRWKPVFRDFLNIWLATLGVFVACVVVVAIAVAVAVGGSFALLGGMKKPGLMFILLMVAFGIGLVFLLFLASAPARAYREARMFRLVWSNVGVSHVARFKCRLPVRRYVLLRVKNIFLTLFTLGFYRPFALVSEYRMKTESVTLHVKGGLDQLAGQLAREEQGLGDAIADAVGLDLVG